jgi:hypothetical protein
MRLTQETGDLANLVYLLEALAVVEGATGEPHRVAVLLGAADAVRELTGGQVYGYYKPDEALRASAADVARDLLGEDVYGDSVDAGRGLTPDEAITYALTGTAGAGSAGHPAAAVSGWCTGADRGAGRPGSAGWSCRRGPAAAFIRRLPHDHPTRPGFPRRPALPARCPPRCRSAHARLQPLASALRGELALPGTPTYDRLVQPFNAAVTVRPAAVVAAADAYDVAQTVRFARRVGLRVGVQCTGHGAAASMEGALLVHTGSLDECVVHPEGWARVGAGSAGAPSSTRPRRWGLTPLAGSSSGVGVVGYTTGGGLGPLARTYGLASDRVRAFDVATGQGRLVRATPEQHADLFWGLRGGAAPWASSRRSSSTWSGSSRCSAGRCSSTSRTCRPCCGPGGTGPERLPETATTSLALLQLPDLPHLPRPLAGRRTVAVRLASTGSAEEGERLLAPLRAVATPVLDGTGVLPVAALDAIHNDPKDPMPVVEGAALLRDLDDDGVEALLRLAGPGRARRWPRWSCASWAGPWPGRASTRAPSAAGTPPTSWSPSGCGSLRWRTPSVRTATRCCPAWRPGRPGARCPPSPAAPGRTTRPPWPGCGRSSWTATRAA